MVQRDIVHCAHTSLFQHFIVAMAAVKARSWIKFQVSIFIRERARERERERERGRNIQTDRQTGRQAGRQRQRQE